MTAREFFPTMPDEVFDIWLAPFISQIGWPFKATSDDIGESNWKYLLGNVPLSVWFSGSWKRVSIDITTAPIAPMSILMADEIISHCTTGAQTMTANIKNTKERFRACTDFVQTNGTIPVPFIAAIRNGCLEIFDGNHRLAALRYVKSTQIKWVPCWVFTPTESHG